MTTNNRQLNLNLFIYAAGHHEAAWRYGKVDPSRFNEASYYQDRPSARKPPSSTRCSSPTVLGFPATCATACA